MRVVCSYCRGVIREVEPLALDQVSHGLCEPCDQHFSRQWEGLSLGEYLDDYSCPVVVVDGDARVMAANGAASQLLGTEASDLRGLLSGEALECVHARLPEGCGKTVHCRTCTLRRTIGVTISSGQPQDRVPASLQRSDGPVALHVSTSLVGGLVRIRIEPAS